MDLVEGNALELLHNGEQYFPALVDAIDQARVEVFLESYLYADDQTASLVTGALCRAAGRGVTVRVLLDGFGARDFSPRLLSRFQRAGVEMLMFRPEISPWRFARSRLRRLHRKIACIDRRTAFVGGINIIDDLDRDARMPPRLDYAVRIVGPLVATIRASTWRMWTRVSWARLRRRGLSSRVSDERTAPIPVAGRSQRAAFVVRDSLRHRHDIENAYLHWIAEARTEVVIANAYFFPGVRFRRALVDAAHRGVRVVLLLQGRVEYPLLHYASRALYGQLLDGGVEIFEYSRSYLHAKVAVFDGVRASVGSSNIDPFSLFLAQEANLFIDDAAFAQHLRRSLAGVMATGAHAVQRQHWHRLPVWLRVREWLGYTLVRAIIAFLGLERSH